MVLLRFITIDELWKVPRMKLAKIHVQLKVQLKI